MKFLIAVLMLLCTALIFAVFSIKREDVHPGWKRDDLSIVVLVQERAHRRVLGAAATRPAN
jgi:hypothetical protein